MEIFIADKSPLFRDLLLTELCSLPEINVTGHSLDTEDTLESIHRLQPDTVILDVQMLNGRGIEVLREIKKTNPEVKVIIFTNNVNIHYMETYFNEGADFCLDKSAGFEEILHVLKTLRHASSKGHD